MGGFFDWLFGRDRRPRGIPTPHRTSASPSRPPLSRGPDSFAFDGLDRGSREDGTAASSGAAPGSSGAAVAAAGGALALAAGAARAEHAASADVAAPPPSEPARAEPEASPSGSRDADGDGEVGADPAESAGGTDPGACDGGGNTGGDCDSGGGGGGD